MDTVHTTKEKCEKVQALIDAVHKINEDSHEHNYDPKFMTAMLESLNVLADEAQECLNSFTPKPEHKLDDGTFYGIPKQ